MRLLKLTLSILTISIFIACGGNNTQEDSGSEEETMTSKEIMQQRAEESEASPMEETTTETEETATEENNVPDVVELTIEGNDQMQFNKDELRVKAGQTVKLTLKHVGEMTKQQMGHNWVLLKQGTKIAQFGQKAAGAPDNGYIPKGEADEVIVHTKLLGGGEQTTITFEAPEKGTYDFICSFPGHWSIMQGKFIVE